jgi:hypothetical protein
VDKQWRGRTATVRVTPWAMGGNGPAAWTSGGVGNRRRPARPCDDFVKK